MDYFRLFFSACFFENLSSWHAVGLACIVLFSYTINELVSTSARMSFFVVCQTVCIIIFRPFFHYPGWELFLLPFLLGIMLLLTVAADCFIPQSKDEDNLFSFLKRGDVVIPMFCAILIQKNYDPIRTVVYSFGLLTGFLGLLTVMTTMSIKFSFHRLQRQHVYMIKLLVLAVLALINL